MFPFLPALSCTHQTVSPAASRPVSIPAREAKDAKQFHPEGWYFADKLALSATGPPGKSLIVTIDDRKFTLTECSPGNYNALQGFDPPIPATLPVKATLQTPNGSDEFSVLPDPFTLSCSIASGAVITQPRTIVFSLPKVGPRLNSDLTVIAVNGPNAEIEVRPDRIQLQLAPGDTVVDIHAVDEAGKRVTLSREFKVGPFVSYEALDEPLKPGDLIHLQAYANSGADVRLKFGSSAAGQKLTEIKPGEYCTDYVVKADDDLDRKEVGVAIDGAVVWAAQPSLHFEQFRVANPHLSRYVSGTALCVESNARCELRFVDRIGATHLFREQRPGEYALDIPKEGFPGGVGEAHLDMRSAKAAASAGYSALQLGYSFPCSGWPLGPVERPPTTIRVESDFDPLISLKAGSSKLYLNGKLCRNAKVDSREVIADVGTLYSEGVNQCRFESEDILGNPVKLEWTFTLKAKL